MPVVTKTVLKSYFEDGKEPNENKYIDLIDTMALSGDIISDHGGLTGLGDDDHTQYFLADGSRMLSGSLNCLASGYFGSGTGQTDVLIRRAAGQYGFLGFYTGIDGLRWRLSMDNDAESGGNVGSSFSIYRYSDTGAYLGNPLWINRATGQLSFSGDIYSNANVHHAGGMGIGSIGFVTTSGRLKVTERVFVGSGLYVGNTSPSTNPNTGDIVASANITAGSIFYGQDIYLYEGTTQMTDITSQDTTWTRINQNTAHNIYTPRYFAAAAGLQAGGSTNPGSGYVGYTLGLRPNKNSTQYVAHGFVNLTTPLTSTAWDGDAKGDTTGTVIDLSANFGVPAGIEGVYVRIVAKANNNGPTDSNFFYIGPSATYDAYVGTYVWGNVYMDNSGIAACDTNGDVWYTVSSGATCYCIIRVHGYFI